MIKKNFDIRSGAPVSKLFLDRKITTFADACEFIKNLPYGRNENKNDLRTVFTDKCGTCSTKHALLRQVAIENNADNVRLILGVFKMTGDNTPEVADTLKKYDLQYIPEAHNYLTVDGEIVDCTKRNSSKNDFVADLLSEIEIEPNQITEFKVSYHQAVLKDWLLNNSDNTFDFADLWAIREECIVDLSDSSNINR
ncbi:MAG: hypothetical protein ACJ77K_17370 [Bacteroidia bacterium]